MPKLSKTESFSSSGEILFKKYGFTCKKFVFYLQFFFPSLITDFAVYSVDHISFILNNETLSFDFISYEEIRLK